MQVLRTWKWLWSYICNIMHLTRDRNPQHVLSHGCANGKQFDDHDWNEMNIQHKWIVDFVFFKNIEKICSVLWSWKSWRYNRIQTWYAKTTSNFNRFSYQKSLKSLIGIRDDWILPITLGSSKNSRGVARVMCAREHDTKSASPLPPLPLHVVSLRGKGVGPTPTPHLCSNPSWD